MPVNALTIIVFKKTLNVIDRVACLIHNGTNAYSIISAKWSSTEEINYKESSGSFKDIPKVSIKVRRVSKNMVIQ